MPHERPGQYETPFIRFPEKPRKINIGGFEVYEYISPEQMNLHITDLINTIDIGKFYGVVINLNGGDALYEKLTEIKKLERQCPYFVEYHRIEEGNGVKINWPVRYPFENKKVLIVEDIQDRGWTLAEIFKKVDPASCAIVAVRKRDIPGQILDPRIMAAVEVEGKYWLGGCGMDAGFPGEGDIFRNYPGIVVNPNKL